MYIYICVCIFSTASSRTQTPFPVYTGVSPAAATSLAHASSAYIHACIHIPLHAYIHTYTSKFLNSLPLPHPYVSPTAP